MPEQRIVAAGASAGGVEAMLHIGSSLPPDVAAPVFLVIHVPAESPSILPELLSRRRHLQAKTMQQDERPGKPSVFSCPDCGGMLREIAQGDFVGFRCRVGHAYSPESMLGAQNGAPEEALWAALQTLEDNSTLAKPLATIARRHEHEWMAARFDERERTAEIRRPVVPGSSS